jgi:hypothetical protein
MAQHVDQVVNADTFQVLVLVLLVINLAVQIIRS